MEIKGINSEDSNTSISCIVVDFYSQVNRILAEINSLIHDTAKDCEKNNVPKRL
jgi:hypothetical protein